MNKATFFFPLKKSINSLMVFSLVLFFCSPNLQAQKVLTQTKQELKPSKKANPIDFGKMWTFENPPKERFKKMYNFSPDETWWKDVQQSSLRFANWCSASFVSPNGLIMTNHHCSRDVALEIQKDGESFDENGFYATSMKAERKAEGLYVDQLIKTADITDEVMQNMTSSTKGLSNSEQTENVLEQIKKKYASLKEWKELSLEVITYFSGAKYSLYGYKRYNDIRLVIIPELQIGYFGGDPDNFTYPRYVLDYSFWRAYDDTGNPLNSSKHYFKFNTDGVSEGEPVFTIGNPGNTERHRSIAQLEYDRDFRYPQALKYFENRLRFAKEKYKTHPSEALISEMVQFTTVTISIRGVLEGLYDENYFRRKVEFEKAIRAQSSDQSPWDNLAKETQKLTKWAWAMGYLRPSESSGKVFNLLHTLSEFEQKATENAPEKELMELHAAIVSYSPAFSNPEEKQLFEILIQELKEDIHPENDMIKKLLASQSVTEYVNDLFKNTFFKDAAKIKDYEFFIKKIKDNNDPILTASHAIVPAWNKALEVYQESRNNRSIFEADIAKQSLKATKTPLSPDATMNLRISDGIIGGYEDNGTPVPAKTTFFGLYNRHYAQSPKKDWALPERWKNPTMELLYTSLNFVTTNDLIGGSSGSPVINKNKEVVGLIFDTNRASLPSVFIYDDEKSRAVCVHVGGIVAALRFIYGADRLILELEQD